MAPTKKALLKKTYELFMNSVMDMSFPLEKINSFVPSDIMVYGTTIDERILNKEEFINLLKRQRAQAEGELEWVSNPVFQRISKDGNTALFVEEIEVTMKMVSGTHIIPLRISTILSFDSGSWQLIHCHGSQAIDITDDTWHKEEWKQKNEALQKLVDEKTIDLEAKNRELEVEASLERIRSKTNAMQESSQLGEVIKVVFEEAIALDIGAKACDLIILDKQSTSHEIWISGELDENDAVLHAKIQHIKHFHHEKTVEAWKRRRKLRRTLLKGRSSHAYMKRFTDALYDHNFPPYVIDFLCSIESVHHTDAYMKYGLFRVASVEPLQKEEEDYLKRFAEVFEQTYTRFLDLKKAEGQAREAEIEAALERVRARSMAMHKSDELKEVVATLYHEVNKLNLVDWGVSLMIFDEDKNNIQLWFSDKTQKSYAQSFEIPLGHKVVREWWKFWRSKEDFMTQKLENEKKSDFNNFIFTNTGMKDLPEPTKEGIKNAGPVGHFGSVNMAYGIIQFIHTAPFTDLTWFTFKRFTVVFEQAYTRFLDIKKAEAQAREAQIEAAMERIRSRALAMRTSKELMDVMIELRQQIDGLGQLDLEASVVHLYPHNERMFESIAAVRPPGESGEIVLANVTFPVDATARIKHMIKMYQSDTSEYTIEFDKKMAEEWQRVMIKYAPMIAERRVGFVKNRRLSPRPEYWNFADFSEGSLLLVTHSPASDDTKEVLRKAANVFDLAYKRYKDLIRAEDRAREAQIEASLERVRSRTMAMHNSEELSALSLELVKQVQILGKATWFCAFNIYDDDSNGSIEWGSNGENTFDKYRTPREGIFLRYYKEGKKGKPFLINEIGPEKCPAHYDYLCSLPGVGDQLLEMKANGIPFPDQQVDHIAYFKYGYLLFITYEPAPELHDIFKRFAKVFEQSYARFLDLKKAEEQAWEAQVEAALERVRARLMAMQSSHEFPELIDVLYQQFRQLGFDSDTMDLELALVNDTATAMTVWSSNDNFSAPKSRKSEVDLMDIKALGDQFVDWKELSPGKRRIYSKEFHIKGSKWRNMLRKLESHPDWGEVIDVFYKNNITEWYWMNAYNQYGAIMINAAQKIEPTVLPVLKRFSEVFEQSYTRFLDLQRAEEQAREAQIEAALERVRAQTMAMHNSEDVGKCTIKMFSELTALGVNEKTRFGIGILNHENENNQLWTASKNKAEVEMHVGNLEMNLHPLLKSARKAWKEQKSLHEYVLEGEDLLNYYQMLKNAPDYEIGISLNKLPPKEFHYGFVFEHGFFYAFTPQEFQAELINITKRFTLLFAQTYQRYLDLVKAEGQAREAQIEVALERVRARTMAMHKSSELSQTVAVLFEELKNLGDAPERMNIGIIREGETMFSFWATEQGGNQIDELFKASIEEPTTIAKLHKAWKSKKKSLVIDLSGKELKQWIKYLRDTVKMPLKEELVGDRRVHTAGFFPNGVLLTTTPEPVSEAVITLLLRFADVFKLTYTRFLDLQKAEEQAKEAQIEAALERVRSQAMAMQESTDLLDIVVTMRTEFVSLGHQAHYFWHMRYLPDIYEKAMTSGDGTKIGMVMELPRPIHGDIPLIADWEQSNRPTVVYAMDADTAVDYITKMITLGDFKQIDPQAPDPEDLREIGGYTFIMARTTHGEIGFSLPGKVTEPPQESITTLERFAGVFDLAYQRFEDLLASEARAREAIKESSLDRVRAEIASMRTTSDLEQITPLLWQELGTLGVPFFRCGVFIVNDKEEMVHAYLSTPEGQSLAALHLSFDDKDISLVQKTVEHWQSQKNYNEEWTRDQFIKTTKLFLKKGQIEDSSTFQAGEEPPDQLILQLVPFKQGMLYAGSEEPLVEEHIGLIKDLADAFAVAYARYEDFVKLEEAKEKVENTLTDLKSAQSQLVHAEKMASLGELTAGIAHEIQNPLNFVNNFSDVNKELMEELLEVLANGDTEEVKAIAQDIIDNDAKIVHHGKRAEGIVKGMLQHSRTSSGEKELTDINVLADEYLRLSYHGLRAKDKSFNADFKLDLDDKLPKINVVPQDIGRVMLNLINNAFHAVKDVNNPNVIVSTRSNNNTIEISVQDNGTGIPKEIKDKIFQPFFTTKATGEGTGLGLSLSYDIITKGHDGELKMETKEHEGSTFIIILRKI